MQNPAVRNMATPRPTRNDIDDRRRSLEDVRHLDEQLQGRFLYQLRILRPYRDWTSDSSDIVDIFLE